jgi:phosphoglucosamine mutase
MTTLFGTDGIRGVANQYPLTADMAVIIGQAIASFFMRQTSIRTDVRPATIIVGKDTRLSGDMLEQGVCAGITSTGARCCLAGVLPTPGIAYLTVAQKADAGVVISASHNPYGDNGIKVFQHNGYKLSGGQEAELEKTILNDVAAFVEKASSPTENKIIEPGRAEPLIDAEQVYSAFLQKAITDSQNDANYPPDGLKLVIDCAHGATYKVAPLVFPEAQLLFAEPNGTNINNQCGSERPETLRQAVTKSKVDAGFAFDGDGDRLIAVDETGQLITGDRILAICAKFLKESGQLNNNRVVSTVMSNMGLTQALNSLGIDHVKTAVGDRYVSEEMRSSGAVLGGEDSGHIILGQYQTTGDGMLTALMLCRIMAKAGQPLSKLAQVMTIYPQSLINVTVADKPEIESVGAVQSAIKEVNAALGDSGRVLVRYSGTQPACRVMVEGPEEDQTRKYAEKIADAVRSSLGRQ